MIPLKFSQKGAWPGSRDPLNFWPFNVNSAKTIKATVFKFDIQQKSFYYAELIQRIDVSISSFYPLGLVK